jgi:hypothetical protein
MVSTSFLNFATVGVSTEEPSFFTYSITSFPHLAGTTFNFFSSAFTRTFSVLFSNLAGIVLMIL